MSNTGILIIGGTGMLGRELAAECNRRGTDCRTLAGRDDLDVTHAAGVAETRRIAASRGANDRRADS